MNTFNALSRKSLRRNTLLFLRSYGKKNIQEGCECPVELPPEKIVVEKKCLSAECTFLNWKPKPRKVIECEVKEQQKPKKPMKCYPGMVTKRPKPKCKTSDTNPLKRKPCMAKKDAQTAKTKQTVPPPAEGYLPFADWDSDCK